MTYLTSAANEFRKAFDQPSGGFQLDRALLQARLIREEAEEFEEAIHQACENITDTVAREAALKELADLVYVCFQFATAVGWDLEPAYVRVHNSNMSKLVDGRPLKREDGKVLKGPAYRPPILSDLV